MARKRTKKSPVELPDPGRAFLMPLADGRFGICRVIRTNSPEERRMHGEPCILVAAAPWIGEAPPDLSAPVLRDIHRLNHHKWRDELNLSWVHSPPPDDFQPLGTIEPTAADQCLICWSSGGWSFAHQLFLQWQWDHDREAVLRADAQAGEQRALANQEAERLRREARAALQLADLRKKKRFSEWKGVAPSKATTACRTIFRDAIDALLALGRQAPKPAVLPILQTCIERLNDIDEQHNHFIETTLREDICAEFDEIVAVCGLSKHTDLADRWRNW